MLDGSTHSARLVVLTGGTTRRMHLACARARWRLDGRELPDLLGTVDLDLGSTPVTNLLPIRRLRLRIGERRELTASGCTARTFRCGRSARAARAFAQTSPAMSPRVSEEGIVRAYGEHWIAG